jgi:hypothetical protein
MKHHGGIWLNKGSDKRLFPTTCFSNERGRHSVRFLRSSMSLSLSLLTLANSPQKRKLHY